MKGRRLIWLIIPSVVLMAVIQSGDDAELPRRVGPDSYRIVYRIDIHQDPPSTTYEERVVDRPFVGRLLQSTQPEFGTIGVEVSGTASLGTRVFGFSGGESRLIERRAPEVAVGDQAIASVIDRAVADGLVDDLESSGRVAGRSCRLYATSEPSARRFRPPTAKSRSEFCLDEHGLLLLERWSLDGRLALERTAIVVEDDHVADASAIVPGADAHDVPPRRSSDGLVIDPPTVPRGFRMSGPFHFERLDRVVGLQVEVAWALERRSDFIVVQLGSGRLSAEETTRSRRITTNVGDMSLWMGYGGSEMRGQITADRWLRVTSTIPPDALESYVSTLRRSR